jgi:hypothetical protein
MTKKGIARTSPAMMNRNALPLSRHTRDEPLTRHARLYAGHPRLSSIATPKTWMAGTSPAMTKEGSMSGHDELKGTAFSRHARA